MIYNRSKTEISFLNFLTSAIQEKLAENCVKHHYILYNKDETLSPLGQVSILNKY